jgi:hypothetical protein
MPDEKNQGQPAVKPENPPPRANFPADQPPVATGIDQRVRTMSPSDESRLRSQPEPPDGDESGKRNLTRESLEDTLYARFLAEGKGTDEAHDLARKRAHEMTLSNEEAAAARPARGNPDPSAPVFRRDQRRAARDAK